MIMKSPLSIMCDAWEAGCINRFDSEEYTAAKARQEARRRGWVCNNAGDYCPEDAGK